ncbi:sulfatase [Albibacterium indicum]|uniref:sulfatase n=1 Tax=Albibacterium indicum TaxID=2292082 RepID=UPI000E4795DF|nr:sulfatase [Pedobacter indicus]
MKYSLISIIVLVVTFSQFHAVLGQEVSGANNLSKPNVLFLFVDDLRADLGAYGNKIVRTPNLDSLAERGFLFTNQYANVPTCGASRYVLLTGKLPQTTGHLSNDIFAHDLARRPKSEVPESFVDHLRRNGYKTIGIGKISHSADGYFYPYNADKSDVLELPYSWEEMLFNPGEWETGWKAFFAGVNGRSRITLNGQMKPYESVDVTDTDYPDGLTAQLAIDKLDELADEDEPFFLGVGFFKPHLPFNAPKKYWDLYNEDKIPLSESPDLPENVDRASLIQSEEFNQYKLGEEHPRLDRPVSDAYARKLKHAYYASISYVDAMIGKVLQTLREKNLDRNTIIIVWGDHGWQLGDHRIWGKHTLFDLSLKSTYIMKLPGDQKGGRVVDEVISAVDLYPTLMDLCGISMPAIEYDGASYAKLLTEGKDRHWKNTAFAYFKNGISLKTSQYRITKYFRDTNFPVELYDHRRDPHESKNIVDQKPKVVDRLLIELEKGNTGLYNGNK